MPFVPGSSRAIVTNPKTDAQLRATLAKLAQGLRADKIDITILLEDVDLLLSATRREAIADVAVAVGDVLRIASAGHVTKAQANAIGTSDVCGVCTRTVASGGVTEYCPHGLVEKEGWGLTVGAEYYLSAVTAGAIVTAPDVETAGAVSIIIGIAHSATELIVHTQQSILL